MPWNRAGKAGHQHRRRSWGEARSARTTYGLDPQDDRNGRPQRGVFHAAIPQNGNLECGSRRDHRLSGAQVIHNKEEPMEIQFPDIPLYKGWGHPYRVEATIRGLELVEGHLPPEIEGTLLRCGPDRQYPPRNGSDVFIDGEGMVHTFRFSGGQVDYMSRWVRTERFVLQAEARRALFGRYRNRFTNAPEAGGARMGTANTNLVFHAGKLLALKEDDLPYELDPQTLE